MKRDCPPLFHYTQTVTATGQAAPQPWQRVIDPIWCDAGIGSTCNIAKGNQITTSESLNIGIDGGPSADDVAGEALKGINANAGFSLGYTWSQSHTSTDAAGCNFAPNASTVDIDGGALLFSANMAWATIDIYQQGNFCAMNHKEFVKTVNMSAPVTGVDSAGQNAGAFRCRVVATSECHTGAADP